MGRTIAGAHFYGPTSPDAVEVPPRLGALGVVACRDRGGDEADLAVVDREPAPAWRGIADEGQRRAWRGACDGRVVVWHRLYGPELDAVAEHRALAAAIRNQLAERGR